MSRWNVARLAVSVVLVMSFVQASSAADILMGMRNHSRKV